MLLSDNKIYQLGTDDYSAIERIMNSMNGDFDIPGYDSETLEELYGINSISQEARDMLAQPPSGTSTGLGESVQPSGGINGQQASPPANVAAQRAEYEEKAQQGKYVICPNCGERIEI